MVRHSADGREDVRRVDEKIGPEIFPLRITGDLAQIGLQLLLARAPGEIAVGLGKAELGECLHDFWSGERLGKEYDVRIYRLHFANQPFPERKRLGVRIVDAEDADTLPHPEQQEIAQGSPEVLVAASVEIGIDDVLVFLRRVFRVLNRTIGPTFEPFWMLGQPRMVRARIGWQNRARFPSRSPRRPSPAVGSQRACRAPDARHRAHLRLSRWHRDCRDRWPTH